MDYQTPTTPLRASYDQSDAVGKEFAMEEQSRSSTFECHFGAFGLVFHQAICLHILAEDCMHIGSKLVPLLHSNCLAQVDAVPLIDWVVTGLTRPSARPHILRVVVKYEKR